MKKILCFLTALILCSAVMVEDVSAVTFDCRITAKKKFKGVMPDRIRISYGSGSQTARISDNVGAKIGRSTVNGKVGRKIGSVRIISWSLSPIPQNMKPRNERKFYESTVRYRARIDLNSGRISIRASFVTRVSSANDGINMQGGGRCRRS